MDLKNIPSCLGKSCDSRYLYLALLNVLDGVKNSMGTGSVMDWKCLYYHDFESLINAPSSAIEIPDEESGNDNGGESQGWKSSPILLPTFLCLIVTIIFVYW